VQVDFAVPKFWGSPSVFARNFGRAITDGHRERATHDERNLARIKSFLLNKELLTFLQRFDESVLADKLPPKHATVLWCRLSEAQRRLLDTWRKQLADTRVQTVRKNDKMFLNRAMALSTHPEALREFTADKDDKKPANTAIQLAQGPKLAVLFEIVRQCQAAHEKLVVFSYDVPTYSKIHL